MSTDAGMHFIEGTPMSGKAKIGSMGKRKIIIFLFAVIVGTFGSMQKGYLFALESSPALEEEKANAEIQRKLNIAKMQHELILLLIEKRSFDSVDSEWKRVLDLKLGAKYEDPIAKSLLTISYELLKAKRFALAQKLLDESLSTVPFTDKNQADIFACKAALYKEAGDTDAAIKMMLKARDLEEKP
jgi:hypothetical protein